MRWLLPRRVWPYLDTGLGHFILLMLIIVPLLATVFGLLVAIPALYLYSFLNSRIKDAVSNMQLFIDEFITKMAEHHKEI